MAVELTTLAAYRDESGNEIDYPGRIEQNIRVFIRGARNRLVVDPEARLSRLEVLFECDDATLEIGLSRGVPSLRASVRVGQDCVVRIGRNVSSTGIVTISAAEGSSVTIGDDVMFASGNQVRADDGHPIFDVRTGKRVNVSTPIRIGNHVWLALGAMVLGGADIGDGSVIGAHSIVTGRIPNNVVATGAPARVRRRDVAWERPHLTITRPYYKPDASTVTKSPYWNLTTPDPETDRPASGSQVGRRMRVWGQRVAAVGRRVQRQRAGDESGQGGS
jgi:acetyltransferase-like isoleucine patch superfamily enzyme